MGSLHLSESKKNAKKEGAVIIFTDEATFRQTPTLHATWAPRGCQPKIPTRGERHSQKIFGAVRLETAQFTYLHHQENFQWETYRAFLDQVVLPAFYRRGQRVYLIQDNAGYLRWTPSFRPLSAENKMDSRGLLSSLFLFFCRSLCALKPFGKERTSHAWHCPSSLSLFDGFQYLPPQAV